MERLAWLIAALLAAALALVAVGSWWRRWVRSLASRRRARHAVAGERDAEQLLRAHGYDIEDRQVPITWTLAVDGEPHVVALRADLLVQRDGRRLVAEVKTGDRAPRLDSAPTRRQLLEYRVAYAVDGVLLVDVDRGAVREIVFPLPGARPVEGAPPGASGAREAAAVGWLVAAAFTTGVLAGAAAAHIAAST